MSTRIRVLTCLSVVILQTGGHFLLWRSLCKTTARLVVEGSIPMWVFFPGFLPLAMLWFVLWLTLAAMTVDSWVKAGKSSP